MKNVNTGGEYEMKKFNIATSCVPSMHYMVDISPKLEKIKVLIDGGEYFTINRGRQVGKTTTRFALDRDCTFWSIILFGVHDIKNLKLKFKAAEEEKNITVH